MTIPVGSDHLFVELPDTTLEVPLPPPVKEFLEGCALTARPGEDSARRLRRPPGT
jgi:hypothetical protein